MERLHKRHLITSRPKTFEWRYEKMRVRLNGKIMKTLGDSDRSVVYYFSHTLVSDVTESLFSILTTFQKVSRVYHNSSRYPQL